MISDTLNKREDAVMNAVYTLSAGRERFLASPYDLLSLLPPKLKFDEEKLERVLRDLGLDGYFELVLSDRKGERVYVVHLEPLGMNYRRNDYQRRRSVFFRWGVAAIGAVITALVGLILRLIFK